MDQNSAALKIQGAWRKYKEDSGPGTVPQVEQLLLYPIKALCGVEVDQFELSPTRGISLDREWALVDKKGQYINGKSNSRVHLVRLTQFKPPCTVTLTWRDNADGLPSSPVEFDLANQKDAAEAWFMQALKVPFVRLVRKNRDDPGFADDPRVDGPTIISRATLDSLGNEIEDAKDSPITFCTTRDRFRPNIILAGVPHFFEDQLVDPRPSYGFRVALGDEVALVGAHPAHRCVVPTRVPSTSAQNMGRPTPGFIAKVMAWRERNFTSSSPVTRLKNKSTTPTYHLSTTTIIQKGGKVTKGDRITLGQSVELQSVVRTIQPCSTHLLRRLVDRGWMVREVSDGARQCAHVLISILPVSISGALVLKDVHTLAKPLPVEVLVGIIKMLAFPLFIYLLCHFLKR